MNGVCWIWSDGYPLGHAHFELCINFTKSIQEIRVLNTFKITLQRQHRCDLLCGLRYICPAPQLCA